MNKIAFLGDIHKDIDTFKRLIEHTEKEHNPNVYIQVGDFGLMGNRVEDYLKEINNTLSTYGKKMYVIDGNHEDHHWLRESIKDNSTFNLAENVVYVGRGTALEILGKNILFVGGAYSIDRQYRTLNISYWEEEVISEADVEKAIKNKNVDVLVSHDVPSENLFYTLQKLGSGIADEGTLLNSNRLMKIVDETNPSVIIHGHYHIYYKTVTNGRMYIGLDCNLSNYLETMYYILEV